MNTVFLFLLGSIIVLFASWKSLFKKNSHGFYRFWGWECILWLLVNNYVFWGENSLSFSQIFSWIFLCYSIYLAIMGFVFLIHLGKPDTKRKDDTLHNFEKTTVLVQTGVFKYIRHPLYASLIFLSWGIFLKNTTYFLLIICLLSTLFMYLASRAEEKENISYFGKDYLDYMKHSKMFIPFIF